MRTCDFVDRGLFTQVWQSQLARKISQPDQNPSRWVLRGTCSRPPKYRRCPIRGKIGQLILCTNEKRSASKQVCSHSFDVHAPNVSLFFLKSHEKSFFNRPSANNCRGQWEYKLINGERNVFLQNRTNSVDSCDDTSCTKLVSDFKILLKVDDLMKQDWAR